MASGASLQTFEAQAQHVTYRFQSSPGEVCAICVKVPWHNLETEDLPAYPHQPSRAALEASAKTCRLCKMVLQAAIANYRDSKGTRHGKGFWEQSETVDYVETTGTRKVTFAKDLGSCLPMMATDFSRGSRGRPIVIPSGHIEGGSGEHLPAEELPDVAALDLQSSVSLMGVWLYGNWWTDHRPTPEEDASCLRLMGIGARFGSSESVCDAINSRPDTFHIRGSSIGVCTDDVSRFTRIPGRLRELASDSAAAFRRLENWISQCNTSHPNCRTAALNQPLPTRVLDVFASERSVALLETRGRHGRYVALSHSWGTSSRLMATTATLGDLLEGIAISSLPKTFQDAIIITKKLGVKYLWIDCLCIIQDNQSDWEREASTMGQVYSNSYITISASSSTDSNTGCFPVRGHDAYISPGTKSLGYQVLRKARGSSGYTIKYRDLDNPNSGESAIHFFEEWLPGSSYHFPQNSQIGAFGKSFDPLAEEPLSTRGWTLQERLLSPRIVHYAKDQMFFECESCLKSEDGFVFTDITFSLTRLLATQLIRFQDHGIPEDIGISYRVGRPAGGNLRWGIRWNGGWLALVENFTQRKLTKPQDKLPALSGLARVIAQETHDEYYAGLWGSHIFEDLFWRVYAQEEREIHESHTEKGRLHRSRPVKGKVLGEVRRPEVYRAPSWSWASLDAPIRFIPLSYSNLVASVSNCVVNPTGFDKFGKLSGGHLDIDAPIYEIVPHTPKKPWDKHGIPVAINFGDERARSVGDLYLDFPDASLEYPCYAVFLDPANALVVRSTGKVSEVIKSTVGPTKLPNRNIVVTSEEVLEVIPDKTKIKESRYKAVYDVERIGVASFVKGYGKKDENGQWVESDDEYDMKDVPKVEGEITPEDVMYVKGADSWGPVTKEDAKVWVTVL